MNRGTKRSRSGLYLFLVATAVLAVLAVLLRRFDLSTPQVPIGDGVEVIMDWLIATLSPALEVIKVGLTKMFLILERFYLWVPWPVWVALVGLLGWRLDSLGTGLLVGGGLLLIQFLGLWSEAMNTTALVSTAVILTILIGVPIGVLASWNDWFDTVLRPVLDAMQTIPSLVYLIPAIMLLGVGRVPAIAATIIFGVPPVIRLTNLGLRQVPTEIKEAAISFGSTRWQLLTKVEMPLAMGTIMAGVNQSTMLSVSMVVIAAFIGAGGLGYSVLFALDRVRIGPGFEAGLAILCIAIVLDRLTQAIGNDSKGSDTSE